MKRYFALRYDFMVKAGIRHGQEFWMAPFEIMTYCLPINFISIFLLNDQLYALSFCFQLSLSLGIGSFLSLLPSTKKRLARRFQHVYNLSKDKNVGWFIWNYSLIMGTILFPVLLVLIRLGIVGVWNG